MEICEVKLITILFSCGLILACEGQQELIIKNSCPVTEYSSFIVNEGSSSLLELQAKDADADPITFTITSLPSIGSVEIELGSGRPIYTPITNQTQRDSITYTASDGKCTSVEQMAKILVRNSTITTTPTRFSDGGEVIVVLEGIDQYSESFEFSISEEPTKGKVSLDQYTGVLTYQADKNSTGFDEFSYRAIYNGIVSDPVVTKVLINSVQLSVPREIHVPIGKSIEIYFDNIVNVKNKNLLRFEVYIDGLEAGLSSAVSWLLPATPQDTGVHTLKVIVKNTFNEVVGISHSELIVTAPISFVGDATDILFIGDSLTANGYFVSAVKRKFEEASIQGVNFIGTVLKQSVLFEGYGGNTWETYLRTISGKSPFVYSDTGLDFARYFDENLSGSEPSYVFIMLGTNDIFGIEDHSYAHIISEINNIFDTAESFISQLRTVLPDAKILVSSIVPPNARAAAFVHNYADRFPRDTYRNVQHVFISEQELYFGSRERENIYFSPLYHDIDTLNSYPEDNALHPSIAGYSEMADSAFARLVDLLIEK